MQLTEIQIELAGICNATCSYCTWQLRTVGKKMMDRDLAIRLLNEAKEMGVGNVSYHGLGESLLHPNLIEIISLGEQLGFNHRLSTNCFNLKGKTAEELGKFKSLQLILAIPWVMPDKFVDICVKNALSFLSQPSHNRDIHLQMVCAEGCEHHYHRLVDTFLSVVENTPNAQIHLKQPLTWPNDSPNKGFINRDLLNHPKVRVDQRITPVSIANGCNMPERFMMILADGTCVPCCVGMDEWGLGTVLGRSLRDVWESPEMEVIRDKWRIASDEIPCGKCKKRTDCLT